MNQKRISAARAQNRAAFISRLERNLGAIFCEGEQLELDQADRDYAWKLATTTSKTFEEILACAEKWVHEERRVAKLEARAAGYPDAEIPRGIR